MENQNKPQWLIDAENEIEKFNNSEFGKKSQGKINQALNAEIQRAKIDDVSKKKAAEGGKKSTTRKNSKLQSKYAKIGASKGGNKSWNNLVEKVGLVEAKRISRERLFSNMTHEQMIANTKKATKVSHENRRKKLDLVLDSIIAELPTIAFSKKEVSDIMIKYGKGPTYFSDVYRQRKDSFKIVGKRTPVKGGSTILYQKI